MNSPDSKPFIIGVSGGVASGKSEACTKVHEELLKKNCKNKCVVLSLSLFYKDLSEEDFLLAKKGDYNFDHPNAFDFKELNNILVKIKEGQPVTLYEYDMNEFKRTNVKLLVPSDVDVVIVEGILTFHQPEVRELFDMKIFVDSDADTRLSRKVQRDVSKNGRSLEAVLDNYFKYVKPAFEQFCHPTKVYADLILPRAPENYVGVDLIIEHLNQILFESCSRQSNNTPNEVLPSEVKIRPH